MVIVGKEIFENITRARAVRGNDEGVRKAMEERPPSHREHVEAGSVNDRAQNGKQCHGYWCCNCHYKTPPHIAQTKFKHDFKVKIKRTYLA